MARPGAQGDEGDDDMMSALDELGDMIRKQQQFARQDLQAGPGSARRAAARPARPRPAANGRTSSRTSRPSRTGSTSSWSSCASAAWVRISRGRARRAKVKKARATAAWVSWAMPGRPMGEAEGALGEGDAEGAVDGQGRALDAMRKGAQGLAQSMQQNGMGMGPRSRPAPAATAASAPIRTPIRSAARCAAASYGRRRPR